MENICSQKVVALFVHVNAVCGLFLAAFVRLELPAQARVYAINPYWIFETFTSQRYWFH